MIYVTHDQVEAMTMGDRICVMRDGKIMQICRSPHPLSPAGKHACRRLHWQPANESHPGNRRKDAREGFSSCKVEK